MITRGDKMNFGNKQGFKQYLLVLVSALYDRRMA